MTSLARHCLSGIGSVNMPECKALKEMQMAKKECEGGYSPTDVLYEFLLDAIKEKDRLEATSKSKGRRKELFGQIMAFSYSIAILRNPYFVDHEAVLRQAEADARQ